MGQHVGVVSNLYYILPSPNICHLIFSTQFFTTQISIYLFFHILKIFGIRQVVKVDAKKS
jgi:hypothetical protein